MTDIFGIRVVTVPGSFWGKRRVTQISNRCSYDNHTVEREKGPSLLEKAGSNEVQKVFYEPHRGGFNFGAERYYRGNLRAA